MNKKNIIDYFFQFFSAFIGCFLTFYIWNLTQMNNIIVCQALILFASLTFPKYDDIFFASALSGMTSMQYLPNIGFLFLVAIFDFIIFKMLKNLFIGFGGKYGVVAFLSNILVCSLILLFRQDYNYPFNDFSYYEVLDLFIYIFGPFICGIATVLGYLFSNYFEFRNKHASVISSGLIMSLLCLMLEINPSLTNEIIFTLSYGEIFILFVQIGLLGALTKEEFLKPFEFKGYMIQHYFLIGYLAGWINIALFSCFWVGGKVGVITFFSTNMYVRSLRVWNKIIRFNGTKKICRPVVKNNTDVQILTTVFELNFQSEKKL